MMRALTILALALAADLTPLGAGRALAQDGAVAERLYREGTEARQSGRVDQAIESLTRAAGLAPDDADTQLQLGLALFAKQRFAEARTAFGRALAIAPTYDEARFGLVRVALATRDLDEAERELKVLRQGGAEASELKVLQGQLDAARAPPPAQGTLAQEGPALRGTEGGPSRSEAPARTETQRLFLEGQAARRAGRFDLAVERFSQAAALAPEDSDAQVELGQALIAPRRFREAGVAFRRALELAPAYGDARLGLARLAFYEKRPAEAERELKLLLAREPKNREALALRAQIAKAASALEVEAQQAEARREAARIEAARVRAQAVVKAKLDAASALRKAGKFWEAEGIYRGLLATRPKDSDLLIAAGSVTAFQGKTRFTDARRDFEAALAVAPTADDATIGLARVDLYENRLDDAGPRLDRVLAKQPDNTEAQALAARVTLARGEPAEAEVAFRSLSLRLPKDTDILLGLGDSLRGTLRDAEARGIYVQAAAADPASAEIQARIAQKIRPRWRLDIDGSYSTLTKGNSDWREGRINLGYRLNERTTLAGGVEVTERFGRVNTLIDARVDHRWSDAWTSYLRLGGAPDADYRPDVFVETGGTIRVSQGFGTFGATLLTLDAGYAKYATAEVVSASPGITQYMLGGRLWLSAKAIGTLADVQVTQRGIDGTSFVRGRIDKFGGYLVKADIQARDDLTFFIGWADAPDASDGRVFPARALFGGAVYDIDETFSIKVSAAHEDRVKSYDRNSVNVGLTTRF
ncbi:tetratricopeptide repeat protein [Methylobacterium iners]|uniref:Beta-barrel assembly-enhancing protease n=1 Tax=Methylobacterium iners TaxID=418707 RepID=A0ABQ4RUW8_9HYPH|nr:tetratricopeptide repeat protein [Methylobacterium iners]GJD93997.1 Beta-barrel assembly-enhancing protease [Methylobacterium iners]